MKKHIFLAALGLLGWTGASAQSSAVTDTVSVGAPAGAVSYPKQVWYSLLRDEQGRRDRTEWHLGFDLKGFGTGVIINSTSGVTLWKYPKANLANGWTAVDTSGIGSWTPHYNSDTAWELGAIGAYADPGDPFNLDWGTYSLSNHTITGDSLFILRLPDGQYRKFAIESLASGMYTFKYAALDGTGAQSLTITKNQYNDKDFAYVNLATNAITDREPASSDWDLLFTQYTAFIPVPYTVSGVLLGRDAEAVRVSDVADKEQYRNYSGQPFSPRINTIGYNWKSFNGAGYVIKDSQLYFVRTVSGDVWKIIFRGFGGSADGNYVFTKQRIYAAGTSVREAAAPVVASVFPNPARDLVHIICDFGHRDACATVELLDLSGRTVYRDRPAVAGLQELTVPVGQLPAGVYILSVQNAAGRSVQKVQVQ